MARAGRVLAPAAQSRAEAPVQVIISVKAGSPGSKNRACYVSRQGKSSSHGTFLSFQTLFLFSFGHDRSPARSSLLFVLAVYGRYMFPGSGMKAGGPTVCHAWARSRDRTRRRQALFKRGPAKPRGRNPLSKTMPRRTPNERATPSWEAAAVASTSSSRAAGPSPRSLVSFHAAGRSGGTLSSPPRRR
jgi:hypothetical protein